MANLGTRIRDRDITCHPTIGGSVAARNRKDGRIELFNSYSIANPPSLMTDQKDRKAVIPVTIAHQFIASFLSPTIYPVKDYFMEQDRWFSWIEYDKDLSSTSHTMVTAGPMPVCFVRKFMIELGTANDVLLDNNIGFPDLTTSHVFLKPDNLNMFVIKLAYFKKAFPLTKGRYGVHTFPCLGAAKQYLGKNNGAACPDSVAAFQLAIMAKTCSLGYDLGLCMNMIEGGGHMVRLHQCDENMNSMLNAKLEQDHKKRMTLKAMIGQLYIQ